MMRQQVDPRELTLPRCLLPRPGQRVVWYENARRYEGNLLGHRWDGRPTVAMGPHTNDISSFEQLRPHNPFDSALPNWASLPGAAKTFKPRDTELSVLKSLMGRTIPPGVTYAEIADEIWSRGYETFLVGGTVRDALLCDKPNDVDLITTIPLKLLVPLMESMCRYKLPKEESKAAFTNGHIRLGGRPNSGDPFVDISVFKVLAPGSMAALFGADFIDDMLNRDFTCNAVYYDPVNMVLIDPSGTGIEDIDRRTLRPVFDVFARPKFEHAKIIIRLFKFSARGFSPNPEYIEYVRNNARSIMPAMNVLQRCSYVRTQVLSKCAAGEIDLKINAFRAQFHVYGIEDVFDEFISPHLNRIVEPPVR